MKPLTLFTFHFSLFTFHTSGRSRRTGFTLVEMLAVIVLIGILMMAAGMSIRRAQHLARVTKAEAECRELVNATLEYRAAYHDWPKGMVNGPVSAASLKSLTDAGANSRGIVFLNLSLPEGVDKWNDPWGRPYEVYFNESSDHESSTAIETCVSFPFRNTAPLP